MLRKISLFLIVFLVSQNLFGQTKNSFCGTPTNVKNTLTALSSPTSRGGAYITYQGVLRVVVVFIQFKDDSQASTDWPLNTLPNWALNFVNANPGNSFPYNNLSQYFYEMSNGNFQVVGYVHPQLMITNLNESQYNQSLGAVNNEILTRINPSVDFSQYDNWSGINPGPDGYVDMIFLMYRNFSNQLINGQGWTGNAELFLPNNLAVDGKIIRSGFPGSGVQMRGGWHGNDYIKYVAAHELGHYLFGGGHIFGVSDLAIMTGGPVWNSSRGMHSWERWKLNWLNYTDVNSNSTVTATDYMTTMNVYRTSISSSEYYSFENREKISSHDWAGGQGVYIYHVTDYGYPPTIDVQCADGNWDFTINPSAYYPLAKSQPNVNGKNEMNYDTWLNGIEYKCIFTVL